MSKSEVLFRAVIVGGSIGLIASWFGFDPARALALGILSGFFAGLTKVIADKKKKK
ncbi:MAG: hypothetical protein PWR24_65 [Desulfonauticus sp.]|nr:MAG: hypothetical protein XD41_0078 [Desulfonauticus sp. 38_4375]MDK2920508.1 hypothetical protein [Desulfonauticus sp.]